jgi:DNA-directed RNA polymerase subunit N (RpoN/RPB10)
MKKDLTSTTTPPIFEQLKRLDEYGVEYWSARDLSKVLEYSEYRHFLPALERAKEACHNSGQNVADHFEDILEMVTIGSKAERQIESVKLSRYACYLIVQNADPAKEVVALGSHQSKAFPNGKINKKMPKWLSQSTYFIMLHGAIRLPVFECYVR